MPTAASKKSPSRSARKAPADSRPLLRGRGALRHRRLGQGVLLDLRRRPPPRPPDAGGAPLRRPEGRRRRGRRPRHHAADGHPLPADPHLVGEGAERGVREGDQGVRLRRRLPRRLPDQGEPEEGRRPRDHRGGPQVRLRPRGGEQARADRRPLAGPRPRVPHHDERLQGRGLHPPRPRRGPDGAERHPDAREGLGARADPRGGQEARREAPRRDARQALRARLGEVGQVGGRGGEVRPDDDRDARGDRDPQGEADARLPRHAPLPHRLADHRHPEDQGRDPRGGARLREADPLGRRDRAT